MKVFNLKQRQMILCASGEEYKGRKAPSDYDEDFAFIPGDMNNMA